MVQAYSEEGQIKTTGGDYYFLHVDDLCYVTDNYQCVLSQNNYALEEVPIYTQMTDNGDGTYFANYTIARESQVTVGIIIARQGGLYAEYFNNAFLSGVPTVTQVDNFFDFQWGENLVTPEAGDFVSIHWFGKLLAPHSEDFTFKLSGDDGFRMYLEGVLVIDRWDTCCDDMTLTIALTKDKFYDLEIHFKEHQEQAYFSFMWSSPTIPLEVVPP